MLSWRHREIAAVDPKDGQGEADGEREEIPMPAHHGSRPCSKAFRMRLTRKFGSRLHSLPGFAPQMHGLYGWRGR